MKVLFLSSSLSTMGGAHRWMLSVLARLQGRVETHLAAGNMDADLPDLEAARVGPWTLLKGLDRRGNRPRGLEGALERLADEIQRVDPHLIQLNDITDPDLIGLAARARPTVMMVQDHRFFCPGRGKVDSQGLPCDQPMGEACARCFEENEHARQMLALTRRRLDALGSLDRITVLSSYMARELAEAGLNPERITVLPPFVDRMPAARPPEAPRHHLLAGRISSHKGIEAALEAALDGLDLPLMVAGAGSLSRLVEKASDALSRRINYVGWAERDLLASLMDQALSLWMPGIWAEPFGIVGLEALSRGVPVIAADTGGIPEWLEHGTSGLLVPPGSASALAQAARSLERHPGRAREMGQAGRARVERDFAPEAIMDRLTGIYEDL